MLDSMNGDHNMAKTHWYKYPPAKIYGTMCGRKITEKTNMAIYLEDTTCGVCKKSIDMHKRKYNW